MIIYCDQSTCSHNFPLNYSERNRGFVCSNCYKRVLFIRDYQSNNFNIENFNRNRELAKYSVCSIYGRIEF